MKSFFALLIFSLFTSIKGFRISYINQSSVSLELIEFFFFTADLTTGNECTIGTSRVPILGTKCVLPPGTCDAGTSQTEVFNCLRGFCCVVPEVVRGTQISCQASLPFSFPYLPAFRYLPECQSAQGGRCALGTTALCKDASEFCCIVQQLQLS